MEPLSWAPLARMKSQRKRKSSDGPPQRLCGGAGSACAMQSRLAQISQQPPPVETSQSKPGRSWRAQAFSLREGDVAAADAQQGQGEPRDKGRPTKRRSGLAVDTGLSNETSPAASPAASRSPTGIHHIGIVIRDTGKSSTEALDASDEDPLGSPHGCQGKKNSLSSWSLKVFVILICLAGVLLSTTLVFTVNWYNTIGLSPFPSKPTVSLSEVEHDDATAEDANSALMEGLKVFWMALAFGLGCVVVARHILYSKRDDLVLVSSGDDELHFLAEKAIAKWKKKESCSPHLEPSPAQRAWAEKVQKKPQPNNSEDLLAFNTG